MKTLSSVHYRKSTKFNQIRRIICNSILFSNPFKLMLITIIFFALGSTGMAVVEIDKSSGSLCDQTPGILSFSVTSSSSPQNVTWDIDPENQGISFVNDDDFGSEVFLRVNDSTQETFTLTAGGADSIKIVVGPSARIISFINEIDYDSYDDFGDVLIEEIITQANRVNNDELFASDVQDSLLGLDMVDNDAPSLSFTDEEWDAFSGVTTAQNTDHRGWLDLQPVLFLDTSDNIICSTLTANSKSQGFTPVPTDQDENEDFPPLNLVELLNMLFDTGLDCGLTPHTAPIEGEISTKTDTTPQETDISADSVTWKWNHPMRVDGVGRDVLECRLDIATGQAPYVWQEIEYTLWKTGESKIVFSGSEFPSHAAYVSGQKVSTHDQKNLARSLFIGSDADMNGGQFYTEETCSGNFPTVDFFTPPGGSEISFLSESVSSVEIKIELSVPFGGQSENPISVQVEDVTPIEPGVTFRATTGVDYEALGPSQTITFPAGAQDKETMSIFVNIFEDDKVENDETIVLKLRFIGSTGCGEIDGSDQHTIIILDDNDNDNTPPSVTVSSPSEGDTILASSVIVSGTAFDFDSEIDRVEVSLDGGTPQLATGKNSWSTTFNNLTSGIHTFVAEAFNGDDLSETADVSVEVIFDPDLVAHYTFEEGPAGGDVGDVGDVSPNELDGAELGTGVITYTADTPIPSSGLALDATDDFDFVEVTDNSALRLTSDFTIEVYVNPQYPPDPPDPDKGGVPAHWILNKLNTPGGGTYLSNYSLYYHPDTRKFGTRIGQTHADFGESVGSNQVYNSGHWYHVAATYKEDSTTQMSTLSLFVDGELVGEKEFATKPLDVGDGTNPLIIGAGNFAITTIGDTYRRNFIGFIDEVRITARALDPSEFVGPPVRVSTRQSFNVPETAQSGDSVDFVETSVSNGGSPLTFEIVSGNAAGDLEINSSTGEITVASGATLDKDTTPYYLLEVTVALGQITSPPEIVVIRILENLDPPQVDNTVAHYKFDNGINGEAIPSGATVIDVSANSLHGVSSGNLFYTNDTPTQGGTAALDAFENKEFVTVAHNSALRLDEEFTIEAFVKPRYNDEDAPDGGTPGHYILTKQNSIGSGTWLSSYSLSYNPDTKRFGTGISFGGDGEWISSDPVTDPDGKWHHVAATFKKDNGAGQSVLTLYVNGNAKSEQFPMNSILFTGAPLIIGAGNFNTPDGTGTHRRNFIGNIDEVRISNQALDPADFLNMP